MTDSISIRHYTKMVPLTPKIMRLARFPDWQKFYINLSPYYRKWTKFSSGISLTSQTWFCSAFGLQAIFAAENTEYCKEKIIGKNMSISQLFP